MAITPEAMAYRVFPAALTNETAVAVIAIVVVECLIKKKRISTQWPWLIPCSITTKRLATLGRASETLGVSVPNFFRATRLLDDRPLPTRQGYTPKNVKF